MEWQAIHKATNRLDEMVSDLQVRVDGGRVLKAKFNGHGRSKKVNKALVLGAIRRQVQDLRHKLGG